MTLTYVRVEGFSNLPRSVEGGRGDGRIYLVPGEGYVAHAGFYADTWSAWGLTGSFLGEFKSRTEAAEALVMRPNGVLR